MNVKQHAEAILRAAGVFGLDDPIYNRDEVAATLAAVEAAMVAMKGTKP